MHNVFGPEMKFADSGCRVTTNVEHCQRCSAVIICPRDGTVGPVSLYREHFTEIPLSDFTTTTLLVNKYNGRKS